MTSGIAREVGDLIRAARRGRGLSQEQLAHQLGKRQATISNWEQGRTLPGVDDLLLIAGILGRDVNELLPSDVPKPPRAITRAVDEQLPLGARFQGSLELFLRIAMISPPPATTWKTDGPNPIAASSTLLGDAGETEPPVDVISTARGCGSRVIGWRTMDDSLAGLLVELEDGPLIAFNSTHPFERQRFTIAHELGHLLLGHLDTFHVDLTTQESEGEHPGYDSAHEKAANSFAANLLMPEPWVRELASPVELAEAAQRFQVSTLALGYRLMALDLPRA